MTEQQEYLINHLLWVRELQTVRRALSLNGELMRFNFTLSQLRATEMVT
ncbi:hypothetical protein KOR42_16790 [Thalassoglobus neptunius]|uniref:Uncharacterized protein n=1 Tax=Thalassoglobus neptunius TaxID=1938619 RepID=A0A5C5X845_9PLAN|nr:hypothetical protein [Thalassoglobus neptunius]TWT58305.1 hypothetical protein KOR42_16790 [Thalassoglobus neptunius]